MVLTLMFTSFPNDLKKKKGGEGRRAMSTLANDGVKKKKKSISTRCGQNSAPHHCIGLILSFGLTQNDLILRRLLYIRLAVFFLFVFFSSECWCRK